MLPVSFCVLCSRIKLFNVIYFIQLSPLISRTASLVHNSSKEREECTRNTHNEVTHVGGYFTDINADTDYIYVHCI